MSRVKDTSAPTQENSSRQCTYCAKQILDDNFLECLKCAGSVHINCLPHASTPGDLCGDVFFDFTCAKCVRQTTGAPQAHEKFLRQHLPWMLVIIMALYNLSIKSKGLSHHGYFHWRTHIISFIDKNWEYLFEPNTRRRKKWIGSVSGSLSHNSPEYFLSGQELFNEHGWWKLTHANHTPRYIYNLYEQQLLKRQQMRKERTQLDENSCGSDLSQNDSLEHKRMKRSNSIEDLIPPGSCSRTIPYMGRKPKLAQQLNIIDDDISRQQQQQPLNTVQSSLMDFLAESLASDDLTMFNSLPSIAPEPLVGSGKPDFLLSPTLLEPADNTNFFDMPEATASVFNLMPNDTIDAKFQSLYSDQQTDHSVFNDGDNLEERKLQTPSEVSNDACDDDDSDDDDDESFQPRIVQVTNFQQIEADGQQDEQQHFESPKKIKQEIKSDEEAQTSSNELEPDHMLSKAQTICKPSLFTKPPRRNWPWLVEKSNASEADVALKNADNVNNTMEIKNETTTNQRLSLMSLYEEHQLHQKMQKIFAFEQQCQLQIPAYIRRFYRKLCVRKWKREHNRPIFNIDDYIDPDGKPVSIAHQNKTQILDRYQLIALSSNDARKSFYARIAGSTEYELFESPYTQRILHPFIYRSKTTKPPWLKLMCELQQHVTGEVAPTAPIDYCYVRPYHISAVNALLQMVFWPGIEMSECLSYPDYSVVALYRKLVVGCGFLVPDVGYNEAYISFMAVRPGWQRSGIATFMLYHLIQTCMTKDITLHVSATNPAVMLYQKFGFKIEEVILDFYDKYLPIDSKHSRHAFLLRLMR